MFTFLLNRQFFCSQSEQKLSRQCRTSQEFSLELSQLIIRERFQLFSAKNKEFVSHGKPRKLRRVFESGSLIQITAAPVTYSDQSKETYTYRLSYWSHSAQSINIFFYSPIFFVSNILFVCTSRLRTRQYIVL